MHTRDVELTLTFGPPSSTREATKGTPRAEFLMACRVFGISIYEKLGTLPVSILIRQL